MGLINVPWRPFQAVLWDSLASFVGGLLPTRKCLPSSGVPVFIMLPLDVAQSSRQISLDQLHAYLKHLADIGVHGVMLDVWWGLCEPDPGRYDFSMYIALAKTCRSLGLKMQGVMSFHECGGNVGDTVNIPLPSWVVAAGDEHGFWFKDREGNINREYISFGADHEPVLPTGSLQDDETPGLRTPLMAYFSFMEAFVSTMESEGLVGNPLSELEIGLGPCGELRYPSYPLSRWQFPGIGEFQCYDKFLLAELHAAVSEKGCAKVKAATLPPADAGSYNDKSWSTNYFKRGMFTPEGRFFQQWYSERLLKHGVNVLDQARRVVPMEGGPISLAVKISGIHWWKFSKSRAAEATTGYIGANAVPVYRDICKILSAKDMTLNFTCLEMRTIDQPLWARCGPRQLVSEVFKCAWQEKVTVAGENALQDFSDKACKQIVSGLRATRARKSGFTLLRLCEELMEEETFKRLTRFVEQMGEIPLGSK